MTPTKEQRRRLKALHWDKIQGAGQHSVWARLQVRGGGQDPGQWLKALHWDKIQGAGQHLVWGRLQVGLEHGGDQGSQCALATPVALCGP